MLFGQKDDKAGPAPANDAIIFDTGTEDFERTVLQASLDTPVLADFWAPWCGPCRQLGPALEEAVRAAGGKVRLAKINIDDNPELAQALRVQSVPTVFAFFQGQPVTAFAGAKAPSEIKALIDQLIRLSQQARPDAIDIPQTLGAAAQALADGDFPAAQDLYMQILAQDEVNVQAYTGLIRTFIAAGETALARDMITQAPDAIAKDPQFAAARTALELAENTPSPAALSPLRDRVAQKPDDHQARFDLAEGLFAAGQKEEAIAEMVEIVRRNRGWEDEKARRQLLKYFDAIGPADPLTLDGRRKLSSVLFS